MAVARHGSGATADVRAFASQVHPVFMLPPVAAACFGALLGSSVELLPAAIVAAGTFFAVYTAHVKDGYVDYHVRGEDDDHPLTERGCRIGLAAGAVGFLACLGGLWLVVEPFAAVVLAPAWVIGYLHAPQLDMHPIGATMGYPTGIGVVIVAASYAQTTTVTSVALAYAAVFCLVLTGVKVVDDLTDVEYDASIDKQTVGVLLGERRATELAYGLMASGLFAVVVLAIDGVLPSSAPLAIPAFVVVAAYARGAPPAIATARLVRGAYLFLAGLAAVTVGRPLEAVALPDVTVLGEFTYLATEVAFGALAGALLFRAGYSALRRAGRTVLVLYPLAYVWDWYTLTVGVFSIPMRTGVTLVGIPIEEHLFMLVVPALVLGIHETLHPRSDDDTGSD